MEQGSRQMPGTQPATFMLPYGSLQDHLSMKRPNLNLFPLFLKGRFQMGPMLTLHATLQLLRLCRSKVLLGPGSHKPQPKTYMITTPLPISVTSSACAGRLLQAAPGSPCPAS